MSEMISNDKNYRDKWLIGNLIFKTKQLWSSKENSTSSEEQEYFQKQIDSYFEIIKEEILKPHPPLVESVSNEPEVDDKAELKSILRYLYIAWEDENLRNQFYNFFGIKNLNKLFPTSKKEKLKYVMYSVIIVILSLILAGVSFWIALGIIEKII